MTKLLYICDWLPPDFGAVGQYSMLFARERAFGGEHVTLAGLSSETSSVSSEVVGSGSLTVIRLKTPKYDRADFRRRATWTLQTDLRLLWRLRQELREADEILFTGSPPFLVHLLAPLNKLLKKRLVYRITDFHPECLMAGMTEVPRPISLLHQLTVYWRRRVDGFEVLGEDQRERLAELGIPPERVRLKRCPSPVNIAPDQEPLARPAELTLPRALLYSGNWGVAHDIDTFVAGYARYHRAPGAQLGLWLNATGAGADQVEERLEQAAAPVHRSHLVPLEQLPALMVTPDAHLITLRDSFVGYVLPSKVYACVASRKPVLFIGSARSDVHLVCSQGLPQDHYRRVETGDAAGVADALAHFAHL